jgi:hypothetical protein
VLTSPPTSSLKPHPFKHDSCSSSLNQTILIMIIKIGVLRRVLLATNKVPQRDKPSLLHSSVAQVNRFDCFVSPKLSKALDDRAVRSLCEFTHGYPGKNGNRDSQTVLAIHQQPRKAYSHFCSSQGDHAPYFTKAPSRSWLGSSSRNSHLRVVADSL